MAGTAGGLGRMAQYQGGMTLYVLVVAVEAAIGGFLFGLDIGAGSAVGGGDGAADEH